MSDTRPIVSTNTDDVSATVDSAIAKKRANEPVSGSPQQPVVQVVTEVTGPQNLVRSGVDLLDAAIDVLGEIMGQCIDVYEDIHSSQKVKHDADQMSSEVARCIAHLAMFKANQEK